MHKPLNQIGREAITSRPLLLTGVARASNAGSTTLLLQPCADAKDQRKTGRSDTVPVRCSREIPSCHLQTACPHTDRQKIVTSEVADGSTVKTDGLASYNNLVGTNHDKQVVGNQLAHNVLPWIHRIFSNFNPIPVFGPRGKRPETSRNLLAYLDRRLPWPAGKALTVLPRRIRIPFQSKTKSTRRTKIAAQSGHEVQTHDL